jgi:type 1 glutamine amidotransferase
MHNKTALIVWGGWDGHEPKQVASRFARELETAGMEVEVSDTLDSFLDAERLSGLDLIVPIWTMGEISKQACANVIEAVAGGTGLAGCHGGMCDAFRASTEWQFMTGGNWVSHPGGDSVTYPVQMRQTGHPLVEGIPDFEITSEQYYLHIDPAVTVLATTPFPQTTWYHSANGHVDMPVAWCKRWGAGRVYYNALGHHDDVFDVPEAMEMMRRGLLWAAESKVAAQASGLSRDHFTSDAKMF